MLVPRIGFNVNHVHIFQVQHHYLIVFPEGTLPTDGGCLMVTSATVGNANASEA